MDENKDINLEEPLSSFLKEQEEKSKKHIEYKTRLMVHKYKGLGFTQKDIETIKGREDFEKYVIELYKDNRARNIYQINVYYPSEFHKAYYKKIYDYLNNLENKETIHLGEIYSQIDSENFTLCEIFIRLIEEDNNKTIKSPAELQELSGLNELEYFWDEETQDYKEETNKAQRIKKTKLEIADTFNKGMLYRYIRALDNCLNAGGKYKELQKIEPTDYYLPKSKKEKIKELAEKYIIATKYNLLEKELRPDLKDLAEELEAPYSLMLEIVNYKDYFLLYIELTVKTKNTI